MAGRWLAVGDATPVDPTRTNGMALRRALVQGSDAGTGPRQLPLDGLPVDPSEDQALSGICTSGRGAIVVGAEFGGPSGTRRLVADGRDHHLLDGRVTAGDGRSEPLAWHSAGGTTWERVRSDAWGGDVAIWPVGADLEVTRVPLAGDLVGVGAQEVTSGLGGATR